MVATRNHPKDFDDSNTDSPTKRSLRSATATLSQSLPDLSPTKPTKAKAKPHGWSHTPSNLTLIWLAVSLPLVVWDTGYVLLRPYSMPGGFLHKPIWGPYDLYGRIDHVYGLPSWESKNGWTAAQGTFNALETLVYLVYAYIVFAYGQQESKQGRGAPDKSQMGGLAVLSEARTVYGKQAVWAVLLAYTTAWITLVKTLLYCKSYLLCQSHANRTGLIEAYSGFHSIGHNDWPTLIFLWIIPK